MNVTRILLILSGYFLAVLLASVLTRNEQWILLIVSSITASLENFGSTYYGSGLKDENKKNYLFLSLNYLKIGIVYGLFMDGFKIGS